eukprot:2608295-Prymnesium_polylepis.1
MCPNAVPDNICRSLIAVLMKCPETATSGQSSCESENEGENDPNLWPNSEHHAKGVRLAFAAGAASGERPGEWLRRSIHDPGAAHGD